MGTLELELFLGSRERWWRQWSRSMRILTEIQAVVCQRSTVLLSETSRFETIPIHLVRVLKAAIRFYAQMMTRSVLGEPIVGPTRVLPKARSAALSANFRVCLSCANSSWRSSPLAPEISFSSPIILACTA